LPIEFDPLGPVRRVYDEHVASGNIRSDPAQIELAGDLDRLIRDIAARRLSSKSSSLGWLFGKKADENPANNGLYIWGSVGRGKSHLMDMFYAVADITPKKRVHFNEFMQLTHQLIHDHRRRYKTGNTKQKDPVLPVGKMLASKSKLLCFDEFAVSDITDAMLLGRLFKVLFDEGTVVVATSNIKPENLYSDGLNRQLFLPFIDLLVSRMKVHELKSASDYRLSKIPIANFYIWPLNDHAVHTMAAVWNLLTDDAPPQAETIALKGRQLIVQSAERGVARFHFDTLCREPRGAADFLAVAKRFRTIMIDEVPILQPNERNEAKRFILLIDILYDNHRCLIVSADGPPEALYQAKDGREAFEFDRTISRIMEMQSREYNKACDGNEN
jgi:cell division protein ZapE